MRGRGLGFVMMADADGPALLALARTLVLERRAVDARAAYDRLLALEPDNGEALRALIALASQSGDVSQAIEYARRALTATPGDVRILLALGQLHRQNGNVADALDAYREAARLEPGSADAWSGMGMALREARQLEESLECYAQAQRLAPDDARIPTNVANVLIELGRGEDAQTALRRAIGLQPDWPEPRRRLGVLLAVLGRFDAAVTELRIAITQDPGSGETQLALGQALVQLGALDEAVPHLHEACRLLPDAAEPHLRLAEALRRGERYDEAIPLYERCLELDPRSRMAYVNLGGILKLRGDIEPALRLARRAVAIDPDYAMGYVAIAEALLSSGDAPGAARELELALDRDATALPAVSNYLLASNYLPDVDPPELVQRHRALARRFAAAPERRFDVVPRRLGASKRLRVGFVSADLRDHSVACFIEPFFAAYDRDRFEVACYFVGTTADHVTARLRGHVDRFSDCAALNDDALANRIHDDRLDILFDLSGHTAGHRLGVFARRPAPVQATYLGYPSTTGLPEMDHRLTDWVLDPAGSEALNVERPVRLEGSAFCYRPPDETPPVAQRLTEAGAPVTFGCFNNLAKFSDPTLRAWARIVSSVPGARLHLKAKGLSDATVRDHVAGRFAAAGVGADRIVLQGWESRTDSHLGAYGNIDVALDTFPYNGATTTCEALWMGVPVVTWSGGTHASRMGGSILRAAGFPEWVAESGDDYVRRVIALASNPHALASLRAGLRPALRTSALLAGEAFARRFEDACVRMWSDAQALAQPRGGELRR